MIKPSLFNTVSDNDLRLLRVFCKVVSAGGFSAAELDLNIGRSTISRHIKELEARLGLTLCNRGRSGFSLTNDGQVIHQAALRLLDNTDAFHREVHDLHHTLKGKLKLAILDNTVTNPASSIGACILRYTQSAPDVEIILCIEPVNMIQQGVLDGRFDIGIIPKQRTSSSLNYMPLFEESLSLYCGQDHPLFHLTSADVNVEQILLQRYVGIGCNSPNMEVSHQLKLARHATAYDQEGLAHFILSGAYIGFLPDHFAERFRQENRLRKIGYDLGFKYGVSFNAISRVTPAPSRLVSTFMEYLTEAHANN